MMLSNQIRAVLVFCAAGTLPCPLAAAVVGSGDEVKVIRFAGYDWIVKDSHGILVGPGPTVFAARGAWVDRESCTSGYVSLRASGVPPRAERTPGSTCGLWLIDGTAPAEGKEMQVVVKGFHLAARRPY